MIGDFASASGFLKMIVRPRASSRLLSVAMMAMATTISVRSESLAQPATNDAAIPFVGCASDGQMGPAAAPTPNGDTPKLPPTQAGQLSYYASAALGVIAPRGWHCFGLYGSGGSLLLVTPERHDASDLFRPGSMMNGSAIQLSRILGDTSGRFEVAKLAARLFPAADRFVQRVISEGIEPAANFPAGPYPADILTRRSPTSVEFVTPGGAEGLGSASRLAVNGDPISGVVILLPAEDMYLVKLDIRLPTNLRYLAQQITRNIIVGQGRR